MDWKKQFRNKFGLNMGQDPSPTKLCSPSWQEWQDIQAFIQVLLEDLAKEMIAEERKSPIFNDDTDDYRRHYDDGHNQKQREIVDTFKEYGIIIK